MVTEVAEALVLEGDCLELLPAVSERATLVYLDPPFSTARRFGPFDDVWAWTEAREGELVTLPGPARGLVEWVKGLEPALAGYLAYMGARLVAVRDHALSPSGSLVLHSHPKTSHYVKLLLDGILGQDNFLNEIVWHYRRWPVRSRFLQRMHDVLLFYRATTEADEARVFNVLTRERSASTLKRWGQRRIRAVHSESGERLPSVREDARSRGVPMDDVWDLPIVAPSARERVGYPTQKPLRLLDRVIRMTTRPGDLVLDPFCGSGTTLVAALAAGRRALGVDVAPEAVELARRRVEAMASSASAGREVVE